MLASLRCLPPVLCAFALAGLLAGCALAPDAQPLAMRVVPSACAGRVDTVLVFLPGAYSDADDFKREGFLRALRQDRIAADALLVTVPLRDYFTEGIGARLQADVVAPAHAQGYRSVWLVGISIGAFGAIVHEIEDPGSVAGIVAIAPYLGARVQSLDVANAGGLVAWRGPLGPASGDARLWRWLQGYGQKAQRSARPPLYLGAGADDRFAFEHRLLAAVLPASHVFSTAGGHDWPAWRRLWQRMLPALGLPTCG